MRNRRVRKRKEMKEWKGCEESRGCRSHAHSSSYFSNLESMVRMKSKNWEARSLSFGSVIEGSELLPVFTEGVGTQ